MNEFTPVNAAPRDAAVVSAEPTEWWRGAALYQIYPRSFRDSNGDGIGDLPGITAGLDHVASLGVDAIWISPFFTSPMKDFGYDVADYCDVDPIFGRLADFDALVERAHGLGLRVIIDQVYAHTSDQHPWFHESRAGRDSPRADWYVWADPKPDGSPPSNWQSVFGGPAWTWDARRGQYYLHNFLAQQPQLNGHHPDVQAAMLDVARFWLDRGVDGFRIDALNFAMHDPDLRDNPPAADCGKLRSRPFDFQQRLYNQSHPDIVGFIERLRALHDTYPGTFSVAEVGGEDAEREMKLFTAGPGRLDSAYGFDFLYAERLTPQLVAAALAAWPDDGATGWPSWAFENHDAPRALSRWCTPAERDRFARLKVLLLTALRGNVILYQGEELGLVQDEIPFELLQDPEAIANWPLTLSRDGVRTPLPWQAQSEHGGFTGGTPWLPLGAENLALAIDRQEADPESLLTFTRMALALRRSHPALRIGSCEVLLADEHRLVVRRKTAKQSIVALFNLSSLEVDWPISPIGEGTTIASANGATVGHLPPFGALFVEETAS